ncbi:PASTA domain-containing protein [Flavobacterium sp. SUN052]|uniref:PASTA domain-containing protein n=1 Tax=Flavobacterium sp. SUN052 TaxID=3002441 RepID=UPI00237DC76A|nr:PASTA domain-containing protein [Flavobacterium sp. SUN052]MEC4005665.1 PASTA domain-containing protein [Flavobacterium sp. SUN052]
MSLRKYLSSKVFVAQLLASLAIVAVLAFLFFHWITFITNHGDEITVPNLAKLKPEDVESKLDALDLDYQIIDTVDYNPNFPKLTVVQQEPSAGSKVKGGRTIYVKLNASTFKMVAVPDLIEKTYRQAIPTLKALGLEVGTTKYVPYIGKDMVLEMWIAGKKVKPGFKVFKATKIDLVLGDGKVVFDDTELDTIPKTEVIKDTIPNEQ